MLKTLSIRNFQAHKESNLTFNEGVNVITGTPKCACGCGKDVHFTRGKWSLCLQGHHRRMIADLSDRTKLDRWRKAVLKRDNYTCQKCFGTKMQKRLAAHHIKPKEQFPELIYDINNGLALCTACHNFCHPTTEETKLKQSESQKNHFISEETKQKVSISLTGRKLTGDHLINTRKARAKQIGAKRSPETCAKIGLGHKGKKMSEEAKHKMSLAKLGKPSSFKGKTFSDESKKKISDSLKNFHRNKGM